MDVFCGFTFHFTIMIFLFSYLLQNIHLQYKLIQLSENN